MIMTSNAFELHDFKSSHNLIDVEEGRRSPSPLLPAQVLIPGVLIQCVPIQSSLCWVYNDRRGKLALSCVYSETLIANLSIQFDPLGTRYLCCFFSDQYNFLLCFSSPIRTPAIENEMKEKLNKFF